MKKLFVQNEDGSFEELSAVAVGFGTTNIKQVKLVDAVNEYIKVYTARKSVKNHSNERMFFNHLILCANKKYVHEVTEQDIEFVKSDLLKRNLKPSSVERRFDVFKNFFQKCIDWEYLHKSPFAKIKKMRIEKNHYKVWSKGDFLKFISTTNSPHTEVFKFMWHTGCRPVEFKGLHWTDVNYDEKTITFKCGKNANISRVFPMSKNVDQILHSIKFKPGLVFQFNGKPINCDNLYQYAKKRLKRCGLDHLTVYGIRHSFATRLCDGGLNAFQIKDLMGHSDIKTTLNYVHPEKNMLIGALNKII